MRKCAGDLCAAKRPGKDKPVFRSKAIGTLLGDAPERGNFSRSQAYSEVPQSPVEYFAKGKPPARGGIESRDSLEELYRWFHLRTEPPRPPTFWSASLLGTRVSSISTR